MSELLFPELELEPSRFIPRDYQREAHDETVKLFDRGERGVMLRLFTGAGKTPTACMVFRTWLNRGPEYRCMVVSYETQLVWQFAQEIEDFLGIKPGIEMERERVEGAAEIVVASRQSLQRAKRPDAGQVAQLSRFGIDDIGACNKAHAKRFLRLLSRDVEVELIRDEISRLSAEPEAANGYWSRLHRFDPSLNWLVCFDEAHRHAYHLSSVGHIVDWFEQNPDHRRIGLTATPKRFDGVSLGHKMFPASAIDIRLFHPTQRCAVNEGYAIPYIQRYVEVEGVDFNNLKKKGKDFDEHELERMLGDESTLASFVGPLLDMVGDRRTLIFNPGVQMAADVALFINARCEVECSDCGARKWFPKNLVGDGAKCSCGRIVDDSDVRKGGDQCMSIHGGTPKAHRNEVYRGHQTGEFQFLSICQLCKEGYNDRDIGCVAIFRPVSKAAAATAEQMKGRGCRPMAGLVEGIDSADERRRLIADSKIPNCLIVDLTGVTGLGDCASTVSIYAEGKPDEVIEKAEELLQEAVNEELDVEEVIEEAERQVAAEKQRIIAEREAAERRAQEEARRRAELDAEAHYSVHEVGYGSSVDPNMATGKQYKLIEHLGMRIDDDLTKKQAGRIIDQLFAATGFEEVARTNRVNEWALAGPTSGQINCLSRYRVNVNDMTFFQASWCISALKEPDVFREKTLQDIRDAKRQGNLDWIAGNLFEVKQRLGARFERLPFCNELRSEWSLRREQLRTI